jgi:hypothetical protein
MTATAAPWLGLGERRLLAQMAAVLDPFATRYARQPAQLIKAALRRAWREEFATELADPVLTRCAQTIALGHPWVLALWSNDYAAIAPEPKPPRAR